MIVFSDMDETFLTADKRVPARNLEALDALARAGGSFVVCTGRPFAALPDELVEHPAVSYAVCANGASVVRSPSGEVIRSVDLPPADALALYEAVRDLDVLVDVVADGKILARRENLPRYPEYMGEGATSERLVRLRTITDRTVPESIAAAGSIQRLTILVRREEDRNRIRAYGAAHPELSCVTSAEWNFEVSSAGATKGAALTWLAAELGRDRDDVYAFGDNVNDISMLRAAGHGIAVANACEAAREAADEVLALTNEQGAVGEKIMELIG